MDYGIQLFSVRDTMPTDMEGTLRSIGRLGYSFVEFAGFFGASAPEVRAMLQKSNLTISGTHTGWQEVSGHFEETVAYHKAIGNDTVIIPGADLDNQQKLDAFIDMLNTFQPRLEAHGIRFAYHNHSHEFRPNADGSVIYEQLLERTGILLELDTYWAYHAGKDPLAMMEALKDRLICIHIKDGLADGAGRPLGMGAAPVQDIYRKAAAMEIPMVVESETLTPDGLSEAKICMEYLRSLERE